MKSGLDSANGCSIVGIGEARIGKRPETNSLGLTLEASLKALEDAGLDPSQVDAVIADPPLGDPTFLWQVQLAESLGIQANYCSQTGLGGAGPVAALQQAVAAIDAGYCHTLLVALGENLWSSQHRDTPQRGVLNWGYHDFEEPLGLVGPPAGYALAAKRHMFEFGTRSDDFAEVAIAMRRHARLNPNAQKRTPINVNDYFESPWIVEPFRLLDCSLVSDYGGALVVTTRERSRDLRKHPVSIEATAQFHDHRFLANAPSLTTTGARESAARLWQQTSFRPEDVDVAEIYDSFTYSVLVQLEDMGFCEKGEAGGFVREGAIQIGGRLPVNTHGGLLSQGHANGILHITEAVGQLRGECGERQVPEAQIALVTGGGGILFASHAAALLSRG